MASPTNRVSRRSTHAPSISMSLPKDMMSGVTGKRTLDAFFKPPPLKKVRVSEEDHSSDSISRVYTHDLTYPFPIRTFPKSISIALESMSVAVGKTINDQNNLDLVYFESYIPKGIERQIFQFLRSELPFYRVQYKIKRDGIEKDVRTPRYTTVFGVDETSHFNENGDVLHGKTGSKLDNDKNYARYPPRKIPECLNDLRRSVESAGAGAGHKFNFCLVNYYASGSDSISYHSDNEAFLGRDPTIASVSLGARRDFLMKHKPFVLSENTAPPATKLIKLPLKSGDMVLMRGKTQANWLHSIPKRTGKNAEDGGRINITFRMALTKEGTENYYHFNVGTGPIYKWDDNAGEMRTWKV